MLRIIALVLASTQLFSCSGLGLDPAADAPFEIGASSFPFGDEIVIDTITSSTGDFSPGSQVTVCGTYDLVSRASATLYFGTTGNGQSKGKIPGVNVNSRSVAEGDGNFELIHTVPYWGKPHITFYDSNSGKPFGGLYFGSGETLETAEIVHYSN